MATYSEIQDYVKEKYGKSIKTCWIADMKEIHGLSKRVAPNRIDINSKTNPYPEDKKDFITEAFSYYKMI